MKIIDEVNRAHFGTLPGEYDGEETCCICGDGGEVVEAPKGCRAVARGAFICGFCCSACVYNFGCEVKL